MKKNIIWYSKKELFPAVQERLLPVETLLDIGCGIAPQPFINPIVHISCDPFDQYIKVLQKKLLVKRSKKQFEGSCIVLKSSWAEIVKIFPPKSVDAVYLIDVIEHLEKKEVLKLLPLTEQIARQQIVVLTPLGFMPQNHPDGKDAWGLDGGRVQTHVSGWNPEDFDQTWQLCASKVFYNKDNMGRKFKKPIGALWAIKNIERNFSADEIKQVKQKNSIIFQTRAIVTCANNPLKFIQIVQLLSILKNRRVLGFVIFMLNKLIKLEHYLYKVKLFAIRNFSIFQIKEKK